MRAGEIYWLRLHGVGPEPEGKRPAVVVQHDRFDRSAINTTVVAAISFAPSTARDSSSRSEF